MPRKTLWVAIVVGSVLAVGMLWQVAPSTFARAFASSRAAGSGDAVEQPESLSTLGPIQPPGGDEGQQKQFLESLARTMEHYQDLQSSADVYLISTTRNSESAYRLVAKDAQDSGDSSETPGPEEFLAPTIKRMRWAYDAGMVRYEVQNASPPKDPASQDRYDHREQVYDGVYSYVHLPITREVFITAGQDQQLQEVEPSWLTLSSSAGAPISEALKIAGAKYEGRQTVGPTLCHKISVPHGPGKIEFWISPENGYRANRSVFWVHDNSGNWRMASATEIGEFVQYDDVWFPSKGRYISYLNPESGENGWNLSIEWAVVRYSPTVTAETFSLHMPLGTQVFDRTTSKTKAYVVGGETAPTTVARGPK